MKIVIINNLYAPWARGGAEKFVERLVAGLEIKGHKVFVITTAPKKSRTEKVLYLESIFYNIEKYPLWQRFLWHINDIFGRGHRSAIKEAILEEKPDLVITNNLTGVGFFVPVLLRKMGIKNIHILHDIQLLHPSGLIFWGKEKILNSPQAKIYQAIIRALFGSPTVIISPSKWLLDEHEKRGLFKNSKKIILPNFFYGTAGEEQGIRNKEQISNFKFIYVGQIEEHKGIKLLVEAFLKFLAENNSPAELIIIGGGSQENNLKAMAAGHLEIKILGRKNSAEVAELMKNSDCLIVPSTCYENSPTVIYEAIEAGLPVIGARLGGIVELLEAAGGILFEPENKADLAGKLDLIFTSREESDRIRKKEAAYQPPDYIIELLSL
jgi:glycosyltransferase involved in cell wall biosynthesis